MIDEAYLAEAVSKKNLNVGDEQSSSADTGKIHLNQLKNKNDNIHKNEVQEIIWSDKYRVTTNITEYHNISKLIFLRIVISKFMKIKC